MGRNLAAGGADPVGADKEAPLLQPTIRNRPARHPAGSAFKVVAFNVRGGRYTEAILNLLARPPLCRADAIVLTEMDWRLPRSGTREIAAELAEELQMSFAFGPEFGLSVDGAKFEAQFGNAILSSTPLEDVRMCPLPKVYDWAKRRLPGTARWVRRIGERGALIGRVRAGGRTLVLAAVHLENRGSPADRDHQVAEVLDEVDDNTPAIIAGDFNTTTIDLNAPAALLRLPYHLLLEPCRLRQSDRHEPLFERLHRSGFETAEANVPLAPTYTPSKNFPRWLRPKLDWIAYRGLIPISGSAAVVTAAGPSRGRCSDHDAIVCDFQL